MDIDVYQQCPCHSEKKIKFCCGKDIVADLNQVLSKNSAGQGLAALEQIDRTIKKTGPKDCLLTIQTHILISHGEIDKAKESNQLFLKNNPKHPTGLQHRALIDLAEERIHDAVKSLQDAMDAITGTELPISLAQAFRMVGLGLLTEGHVVGARAHLQFASSLKGGQDDELDRMIFETFRIPEVSILLKHEFQLKPVPDDVEWIKRYTNANRSLDRGQFRKGLRFLKKIDSETPDIPEVVYGIAVLNMYLGNLDKIGPAWHRYSQLYDPNAEDDSGQTELEAIEAESLAQLFASDRESEKIDIVRTTFELTETDGANELAISNARLVAADVGEDPFEEGPPPRSAFYLLDREQVKTPEELTQENISSITGEMLLFGKQTDRPARLEWVAVRADTFDDTKKFISDNFGKFLSGEPQEQVVAETSRYANLFSWNWHLPKGVTRSQHAELVKQKRTKVLTSDWANMSFPALDGKTPTEAAKDPNYKVAVQAMLVQIEQAPDNQAHDPDSLKQLRTQLGLPAPAEFSPSDPERKSFSPLQQQYLKLDKRSDDELLAIQAEAMAIGNIAVLKRVVPEILNRPELEQVPRDVSYSMMAQLTADDEESLEYLGKARTEAKKNSRPIGLYLVQEFEFRISRGMTEKLPSLLQTIQKNHLNDPDVEYQLGRVLQRFGLLQGGPPPEGTGPPQAAPPQAGVWTPESGTPDQPAGTDSAPPEEPSKLWVPD